MRGTATTMFRVLSVGLAVLAGAAPWAAATGGRVPVLFAWEATLRGSEEAELRWPTAIAARGSSEIAVLDAASSRLFVFRNPVTGADWTLHAVVDLPAPGHGLASTADGYRVALRAGGGLLAIDGSDYRQRRIELPSDVVPGAIAALSGNRLLVADLASRRVLELDEGGRVERSVAVAGGVAALGAGSGQTFYAAFPASSVVRRYGGGGELMAELAVPSRLPIPSWPGSLVVEPGGEIVVADRHAGRLVVLEAGGRHVGAAAGAGWEPGLLRFPSGLARLEDGRLAVADLGNGRVQIFRRVEGR